MDRATLETHTLIALARLRTHPLLVTPDHPDVAVSKDGHVSLDETAIERLGSDGFTWSLEAETPDALEAAVAKILTHATTPVLSVTCRLYACGTGEPVAPGRTGVFLYYRAATQTLFGVHVVAAAASPQKNA